MSAATVWWISLHHYVNGSCGALDAGDALAYTVAGGSLPVYDLNGTIPTLIYALLAGGGLLVVLASWWRRELSRSLCAWMSAWFVAAVVAAALALKGVPVILRARPQLGSETVGLGDSWARRQLGCGRRVPASWLRSLGY